MSLRRDWTEDELRVLAAIYFKADFSLGDDARDECRTIAACFDRSPSAIDRQWRNMDAVAKGKRGLNIGKLVKEAVGNYLAHPSGCATLAVRVCEVRGWPLIDLIREGRQSEVNKPLLQERDRQIETQLCLFAEQLVFVVFPAGAQGFLRTGVIAAGGIKYDVRISAVAVGTRGKPHVHVRTRSADLASAMLPVVRDVEPRILAAGKIGYYGQGRIAVNAESFEVVIRAVQCGENQK